LRKSLHCLAFIGLAAAAPAFAADLPSAAPAPASPYTIDPGSTSADLW
jgi:polyisoprenoid-binding protein YceI